MTEQTNYPFRDASLPVNERVADLLGRMPLEDKVGLMFHQMTPLGHNGELAGADNFMGLTPTAELIREKRITHFNLLGSAMDPREIARWANNMQKAAAEVGLGIPVTISTDPRHAFTENVGTSFLAGCFSQWPETLGLAAIGDAKVIEQFADIARREYLAVGIRSALHPQIDLATEPRWARIAGSFSEDAKLTAMAVEAYVRGFQTEEFGVNSVATMTKHFPGAGPQMDGLDAHFDYGREQVYPGNNFEYHAEPFKAAIAVGTRAMMPYYGMPVGTKYEEVGFSFNKAVITDLLKNEFGFEGVVCTDWGLVTDGEIFGKVFPARAWGVEQLSPIERAEKILNAGCDQLGGEQCPELIIELVKSGRISEERINHSAAKLLREKFLLGLFENPYVDEDEAARIIGSPEFVGAGEAAQRAAIVRLKAADAGAARLPLARGLKVYVEGFAEGAAERLGQLVANPEDADVAIIRAKTPYEPRGEGFELMFHQGSLEFAEAERERILAICNTVPTIFDIHIDRAAIFPEIAEAAAAVLANFGASADALIDVLFDPTLAKGRLPLELPRSMAAVEASKEDVPFDTENPVFKFGAGL